MNSKNNSRYRLFMAGVISVALAILAAVVLVPGSASARTEVSGQAAPQFAGPPLPPLPLQMNLPTATPEPGLAGGRDVRASSSDLEVIQFRPKAQLARGQKAVSPLDVDKPAGESAILVKPPDETPTGPQEAYTSPDYESLLGPLEWDVELYEGFEGAFPGRWHLYDFSDDGYQRTWGDDDYKPQLGFYSAWPAAYGADALDPEVYYYPNNLDSWMTYGPFDWSGMANVFVGFGLWYETEPEYDWVYFCASIDNYHYNCDYWSGDSGGWTDQAYWLTSYAGYAQVWLAWVFQSDSTIVDDGPFVDEIWVWGDDISASPTPTPTPDPNGQLIQNGSFETGDLTHWNSLSLGEMSAAGNSPGQPPSSRLTMAPVRDPVHPAEDGVTIASVGVTDQTAAEGTYSAYLWQPDGVGEDHLYQTFSVPSDIDDLTLSYWFAMTTGGETRIGRDFFCASLRSANLGTIWVDLGCIDSTESTNYWQEIRYTLTDSQVQQVKGKTVALDLEMYNTGSADDWSAAWVDLVQVYAIGGSGGDPLDGNEPNDDPTSATPITCGATIAGIIGDALGGYDVDWFRLDNVPVGQIDVDIAAAVQVPPSALDSVVGLWDSNVRLLDWNDDDGVSYDSYVVYTNTVENATLYISVESYSGQGSPDSFYDLKVQCGGAGGGPPPGGNNTTQPDADTWTVMLYLNGEDSSFAPILTQYRTDIEAFIGSKSFLNVAILYDGPGSGDTTRYLVQPNGSYTLGVNRWDMGELNMGHPDTLANFVSWAMDQYPAENYYLAVDDHGNGVYGISFDPTSNNDSLTPPELYSALKSATRNGTIKIDLFDYEACLMGLAENAYDLRQWVDYVIFSEQISWGINTYPLYFGDLAATDTPLAVGRRIVERYHNEALVTNNGRGYPHTISLIDTGQMSAVSDAVTHLGNAIRATNTQAQKDAINAARDRSQAFAADQDATDPMRAEYIDLWDLADKARSLAPAQAAAVQSAVQAAVVHNRYASGGVSGSIWDHSGAHGLAIYYPTTQSSSAFSSYVAPSLYQMSRDGTWDEFLAWAVPLGNRRGMSTSRAQDRLAGRDDAFAYKTIYLPTIIR